MSQIITIQPNTEIDTIQKGLDAITDSEVTIYVKEGVYQFIGLARMSKADTFITWIGDGVNTIIKFLQTLNSTEFLYKTTLKKLRFKCDDTMQPYYPGRGVVMSYFRKVFSDEIQPEILFENCLFDTSDDGLKPHLFFFYDSSDFNTVSNKTFRNCTFNANVADAVGSYGNATYENCIYNTRVLEQDGLSSGDSIIINTYKDEIDPVTFIPTNYKSYGIYSGINALIPPSILSNNIKTSVYDLVKEELQKYNITFYNEDNTNISTLSDTEDTSTFKDEIVSTINSAIESNTGGD